MKKLLVITLILFCFGFISCTDAPNARRVLSANGYTNIQITGYSYFGCSDEDDVSTGFIAKSPNGTTVEGVVCQGYYSKAATIRFK